MGARRLRLCRSRLLTTGTSSQARALLTLRLVLLDDGAPTPALTVTGRPLVGAG